MVPPLSGRDHDHVGTLAAMMTDECIDLYRFLGLSPQATQDQITHADRGLLRQHHPDTRDLAATGNGECFYANAGERIALPSRRADRPNRKFLEWHIDDVYLAS